MTSLLERERLGGQVQMISAFKSAKRDLLVPVLDEYEPIGSTDCDIQTVKPHISHVVCDSKLEGQIAAVLERDDRVVAYTKNDRLFFDIPYRYLGTTGRYRPDFIIRLANGANLLIEGKGRKTERDDAKSTATRRWLDAVNNWGELGRWEFAMCRSSSDAEAAVSRYSVEPVAAS